MAWVQRDASGVICGVYANQQPGFADEELSDTDPAVVAFVHPPMPKTVLPQDLMAQFTTDDLTKIKAAVDASIPFWGLWSAMAAQKDPMHVENARFKAGWSALIQVLGQARMDAIAAVLNVTVTL